MNLLSIIPISQIECMVTTALLQGLASPDKKPPMDTTPYQLYLMQQQQLNQGNYGGTPLQQPTPPQSGVMPTSYCPPVPPVPPTPRIHNNNLWY